KPVFGFRLSKEGLFCKGLESGKYLFHNLAFKLKNIPYPLSSLPNNKEKHKIVFTNKEVV
uniref:hypothetical protein n=1 Tax=Neisseria sicca TaxID=490 RepID=UPI00288088FA